MFLGRSDYDRGVNTFSPEGRLIQVEYAIEAIKLGSTAIAIKCNEGIVFGVEKRITSPLIVPGSTKKISEIDSHIGCAMSGLVADARTLIDKARQESQSYWFTYNEPIPVESITATLSNLALSFGEEKKSSGMSRPFGVALLIGGVDSDGPKLFHLDPSGTYLQYEAKAIGSATESARNALKQMYKPDMSLTNAVYSTIRILKIVMEDKVTPTNIEIGVVGLDKKFKFLEPFELEKLLNEVE